MAETSLQPWLYFFFDESVFGSLFKFDKWTKYSIIIYSSVINRLAWFLDV